MVFFFLRCFGIYTYTINYILRALSELALGVLLLWSSIYIFIYSFIIFGPSFGHHLYALQPFWTYLSVHVHVLPFLTRNRHPPPATPAYIPLFFFSLFSVLPQRTWVISALMAKPCGRKELIELETCSFQTRWSSIQHPLLSLFYMQAVCMG